MTEVLLSAHVLAAILVVGSITVAASLFPRYALQAGAGPEPDTRAVAIAALLHRICRGYAIAGLAVPVLGLATAVSLGVLTDAWLLTSLGLTVIAAAVLGLVILPGQQQLIALTQDPATSARQRPVAARLTVLTGVFNVLWTVVVVLMIVRPGSTTGV